MSWFQVFTIMLFLGIDHTDSVHNRSVETMSEAMKSAEDGVICTGCWEKDRESKQKEEVQLFYNMVRKMKLGKKLALKQRLRKKKKHRRQNLNCYNNRFLHTSIVNNNLNLHNMNLTEGKRHRRNYSFSVTCSYGEKEKSSTTSSIQICKKIQVKPHELSINHENSSCWCVRASNFQNMCVKTVNNDKLHVETCYSNLRQRKKSNAPPRKHSIDLFFDTDDKSTKFKIKTVENECPLKINKGCKLKTLVTNLPNVKSNKNKTIEKSLVNSLKVKDLEYERKRGSGTLLSCLGLHEEKISSDLN